MAEINYGGTSLAAAHWHMERGTPQATVQVRFSPANIFGIADHHVVTTEGLDIYHPAARHSQRSRVIAYTSRS